MKLAEIYADSISRSSEFLILEGLKNFNLLQMVLNLGSEIRFLSLRYLSDAR